MSSNLKVNNITVKSFRGINSEISLDLKDFTIVYGENGSGKSSFVNSFEYLFKKKLDFLSKSTIKNSAYINENASKRDVKIELDLDDDEYIMLEGTHRSNSPVFDEFLENPYINSASFVVNRDRLLKFIEGTSNNRYKAFIDLLNIKKIDSIQDTLSPSLKALRNELENKIKTHEKDFERLKELQDSKEADLKTILDIKKFNDSAIIDIEKNKKENEEDIKKLSQLKNNKDEECQKYIDEINKLLEIKKLDSIDNNTDLKEYEKNLYLSPVFSMDVKIKDFKKVYENLDLNIKDRLNNILEEYENVASENLKSSEFLLKSLETSIDYIKFTNSDTCPVCNNQINSENIINEIEEKISQINSSNDSLKSWKKNLNEFVSFLDNEIKNYERLNDIISDVNTSADNKISTINYTILGDLKSDLNEFSELKKKPSDFDYNFNELYENTKLIKLNLENGELNQDKSDYEDIIKKLDELHIFKNNDVNIIDLEKHIKKRELEINNKNIELKEREKRNESLNQQIIKYEEDIKKLEADIDNYDDDVKELEKQIELADKTFKIFKKSRKEYINNIFSQISDDVEYYYDFIHDSDEILSPDIVTSDRKIDVKLNSFGENVDSRSFASEGHLDTLGLCIFLAFNKQFNNLGLIVLDDVLTTVDMYHKGRIARLLVDEFGDFQFFITAHSMSWVDELESLCVEENIDNVIYKIDDWSLEDGPSIFES